MYAHFDSQKYTATTQKLYIIYIYLIVGTQQSLWVPIFVSGYPHIVWPSIYVLTCTITNDFIHLDIWCISLSIISIENCQCCQLPWSIGPLVHWFIGPNLLNNMWSELELAELGNNVSNFGIWLYKLILRVIEESTIGP